MFLLCCAEIDQFGENKAHVSALIHNGRIAMRTIYFCRNLVFLTLFVGGVEHQGIRACLEADIGLGEDGTPLEWSSLFR